MITIARTIDIAATAEQTWAILGRFAHIDEFHPRVRRVDVLSEATSGVGASRRCHFKDGSSVVEKVVDWQEGRSYSVQLSEFSMPLNKAIATFAIAPLAADRCQIKMAMDFEVKYGPIGWLMGQTMMRKMMSSLFLVILRGLEDRVVNGKGPTAS